MDIASESVNECGGPAVSLLVPVYNGAAFLRETLNALLCQSYKDFELLVIDDGSLDESADIVRSFDDQRIRLISQENRGLCGALNRGIQEAVAPLIARNDQDDISLPNRLERQILTLSQDSKALAVYTNYTKFGSKRTWSNIDKQDSGNGVVTEVDPLKDGCLLGSSMMARTQALRAIGGYRQECYPCDDYDLETRLAEAGKILLLRERLVAYRFHSSANTYRLFAEMQNKSRWVQDSHRRRLRGEQENDFHSYLASKDIDFLVRLHQRRLDGACLHMRLAGQRYLDGRDVAAGCHSTFSLLLDPKNIFHRIKRLLLRQTMIK